MKQYTFKHITIGKYINFINYIKQNYINGCKGLQKAMGYSRTGTPESTHCLWKILNN